MSSSCNGSGSDIFLTCNISKLLKKARKNVIYFGLVTYLFILRSIPINQTINGHSTCSSCSLKRYFDKKECGMKGVLYFKCASFWSSILD